MCRVGEEGVHRRLFGCPAAVHHQHVPGDAGHDAEIVRDHHDGESALLLEPGDQLQDLGLDGDVEGGGGLVGDEQFGFAGERHGDHHALAHAAGELVRILAHAPRGLGDAHLAEHLDRSLAGRRAAGAEVDAVVLGDLFADRVVGVQAGERVLEDHRHAAAAQPAQLALGQAGQLAAVEGDGAGDLRAGVQAHHREGGHGLAGAGLADDAEGLPAVHREGEGVHGPYGAALGGEGDREVLDGQQGLFPVGCHQYLTRGSTTA
ncbi:hypothetical protein GCM10020000_19110 [Streptomyces olivoverticillatus]